MPLNEHFLALKTKYTGEKDQFEKLIQDANTEIYNIENENKFLHNQIEESNKNYFEFLEKLSQNSDYYSNKIFDVYCGRLVCAYNQSVGEEDDQCTN